MHLFIIRHGECLGQCDPEYYADPDSPLSPRGKVQAHWVAQQLCKQHISAILSSPLLRSLATAHILADVLANVPLHVWMEMWEAWDTPYNGVGRAHLQHRFPRARLPASIVDTGWHHAGDADYDSFSEVFSSALAAAECQSVGPFFQ